MATYPAVSNTLVDGTTAEAADLNTNFDDLVDGISDGSKDLNVNNISTSGSLSVGENSTTYKASIEGSTTPLLNLNSSASAIDPSIYLKKKDVITGTISTYLSDLYLTGGTASGSIRMKDKAGGTELMTVHESGNVGIGDTTPDYKLDVNGSINGSDFTGTSIAINSRNRISSSGWNEFSSTGFGANTIGNDGAGQGAGVPLTVYGDITANHIVLSSGVVTLTALTAEPPQGEGKLYLVTGINNYLMMSFGGSGNIIHEFA